MTKSGSVRPQGVLKTRTASPRGSKRARTLVFDPGSYVKKMEREQFHIEDTVRILRRPPRVFTDPLGHNVWMGDVKPLELEVEPPAGDTDPYNRAPTAADAWIRARAKRTNRESADGPRLR